MTDRKLEELYRWIDDKRDTIIADLISLSSIKSVSNPDEEVKPFGKGCKDVLEDMLSRGDAEGFITENFEDYIGCIGWKNNDAEEESIGIWAHLDVVPEGDDWMSPPYSPVIREGWLFGRGVADNKSAAIGVFYIIKALRELNFDIKHNLKLFLGTNEEKGMADLKYFLEHYNAPKFSIVPDAGFPGTSGEFGRVQFELVSKNALSDDFVELSGGSVFNIVPDNAKAVIRKKSDIKWQDIKKKIIGNENIEVIEKKTKVEIIAHGISSHAAAPDKGVNAIYKLTKVLQRLEGIRESDRKIFHFLTNVNSDTYGTYLNLNRKDELSGQTVSGGTVLFLSAGKVHLVNDCRYCVTDTFDRINKSLQEISEKNDFKVLINEQKHPSYIPKNSKAVDIIRDTYRQYTGSEEAELLIGKGGTYAGRLPNAIATGICLIKEIQFPEYLKKGHGGPHQPDEALPIDAYIEGIKLLATILVNVDAEI